MHSTGQQPIAAILKERWKVTAHPTDGSYYCFDIETTQQALTDLPLTVHRHHYGGMALRGPTRWLQGPHKAGKPGDEGDSANAEPREDSSFTNDRGAGRLPGNLQKTRWVTLTGLIDDNAVSITVMCHPDSFRFPQAARLHPSKPYFCFASCTDGEFTIDKAHPCYAKYRYLVTDSAPDSRWLHSRYQAWTGRAGDAEVR